MMLDDVYGSDLDRFPLEQESEKYLLPELEWSESDTQILAADLRGRQIPDD